MSDSFQQIPDPVSPEHQLLREAGELPELSQGLRQRVVLNVRQQVWYGRWADRLRILAASAAAILVISLVWKYRWTGQDQVVQRSVVPPENSLRVEQPSHPSSSSHSSSGSGSHAALPSKKKTEVPIPREVPKGGGVSDPVLNEMQQLNRLIEYYQQRQNALCGLVPLF